MERSLVVEDNYAARNITERERGLRTTSTRCLHRDWCENVSVSQRLVLGPFPMLCLHCHCSGLTACWILDAAKVSEHVASHTRERTDFQGTMVTPSGRFPSSRQRPLGSINYNYIIICYIEKSCCLYD